MDTGTTTPQSDARSGDEPAKKYQLLLAYADADQAYVRAVAERFDRLGIRHFDLRNAPSMLGTRLPDELRRILRDDTQYVLMFVSSAYANGPQYVDERQAIVDEARGRRFIFPIVLDKVEVTGLSLDAIGTIEARDADGRELITAIELADKVAEALTPGGSAIQGLFASAGFGWNEFDGRFLHCLVITSETEAAAGPKGLQATFTKFLATRAKDSWHVIRKAVNTSGTVAGARDVPADFDLNAIRRCLLSVADALATDASFEATIRMIVEADLALFDVTHFEPAVMLLLGTRAATRRGVTVVSHGADWVEGEPLERPFNLADLSVASHTQTSKSGDDPRVARLQERIETGFEQLRLQPHYHDLPVYDALRRLGSDAGAWSPIDINKQVLVLCSYSPQYQGKWDMITSELDTALVNRDTSVAKVGRLQDFATSQIVSQTLYEKIRRCVGCLVDWTESSPSTFFELGVRLVVSPWGTVQIAGQAWIENVTSEADESAADAESDAPEAACTKAECLRRQRPAPPPEQIRRMRTLFKPIVYGPNGGAVFDEVAEELITISKSGGSSGHSVRHVAIEAMQRVEPRVPEVADALSTEADHFDNPRRQQRNVPQVLFAEGAAIKQDAERAALERRLAAWLYLHHRLHAGERDPDDPARMQWRALGIQVSDDLMRDPDNDDFDLGDEILRLVGEE
jgi:TIR domain